MGVIRAGFTGGFIGILIGMSNIFVENSIIEKLSSVGLLFAGLFKDFCTTDCTFSEIFITNIATILGNCAAYFIIGVLISLGISVIKMWVKPKIKIQQPLQTQPQIQTAPQQVQQAQVQTAPEQAASAENPEEQKLEEVKEENQEESEKEAASKESKIKKADLERMPVYDEDKKQWTTEIKGNEKSKQTKSAKKKPVKKSSPKKSKTRKK